MSIPSGWQPASTALMESAKAKALQALRTDGPRPAHTRLARFYDPSGDYAGASFAKLPPVEPMDITSSDLFATTLLSVNILPGAARRILLEGEIRKRILSKLKDIPECAELSDAGSAQFAAMAGLYDEVKKALSAQTVKNPNAWVTASKICARKRPKLFPVRDRNVCKYLGLANIHNYQVHWQVFRFLISDEQIIESIDALIDRVRSEDHGNRLAIDSARLRVLDAALWTYKELEG